MPAATAAAVERVNAFPNDGTVLFKHYFDGEAVFDRLKPYYNGSQYRFEVPVGEFDSVKRFLRGHGYDVSIVDDPAPYYVAVRQYTAHPEDVFKESVRHESARGYNYFLMRDRAAVESAVAQGAIRLSETSMSLPSGTLGDFAATTA